MIAQHFISFLLTIYNIAGDANNYGAQTVGNIPTHRFATIESVHQLYSLR